MKLFQVPWHLKEGLGLGALCPNVSEHICWVSGLGIHLYKYGVPTWNRERSYTNEAGFFRPLARLMIFTNIRKLIIMMAQTPRSLILMTARTRIHRDRPWPTSLPDLSSPSWSSLCQTRQYPSPSVLAGHCWWLLWAASKQSITKLLTLHERRLCWLWCRA